MPTFMVQYTNQLPQYTKPFGDSGSWRSVLVHPRKCGQGDPKSNPLLTYQCRIQIINRARLFTKCDCRKSTI